jgi:hypothetical protein
MMFTVEVGGLGKEAICDAALVVEEEAQGFAGYCGLKVISIEHNQKDGQG